MENPVFHVIGTEDRLPRNILRYFYFGINTENIPEKVTHDINITHDTNMCPALPTKGTNCFVQIRWQRTDRTVCFPFT